ncbi:MAG: hypothetical protein KY394_04195 [Actinobacteria bacterium]|nr:hypothetical protein [Actinomycetota bacterium]
MIERALGVNEDYGGYVALALFVAVLLWWGWRRVAHDQRPLATLRLVSPLVVLSLLAAAWALWPRRLQPGATESFEPFLLVWSIAAGVGLIVLALLADGVRFLLRPRRSHFTDAM